jgi:3-oxoacyl-[acyl-carrier-protein] synthase-3
MRLTEVSIHENPINFLEVIPESLKIKWALEKSQSQTGINCISRTTEDIVTMALSAYDKLIKKPTNIDVVFFITQSNKNLLPPSASEFIGRANIKCKFALDLNIGCSGFVYGLQLLNDIYKSRGFKKALLICGDQYSKYLSPTDRATNLVFSDGCAVCLFEEGKAQIQASHFGTRYEDRPSLLVEFPSSNDEIPDYKMNGPKVFEYATQASAEMFDAIFKKASLTSDSVDFFLLHQASKVVLSKIQSDLQLDSSKMLVNYPLRGNLTSASIPYLIYDNFELLRQSKRLYLSGFGVGLSHGALLIDNLF